MENEEERKKAAAEAKKAKLDTLEKKIASTDPESSAGKKHRFDDTEYLEESQEIIDNVKSAVSTGWWYSPHQVLIHHSMNTYQAC